MDHNFMKKNLLFHASKVKIQTKYNYFQWVAKKYNELKKINPNFMGYIIFYCLSKQKISNLNSYATFILSTNLSDYSASLLNFFWDPLVCKQRTLSLVRNALIFFFTLSPHETMTFQQVPWFSDFVCYFMFFF